MKITRLPYRSYLPAVALTGLAIGLWAYSAGPRQFETMLPPDENRFTKVVLAEKLNEPLEMTILPDERVLLVERHGAVRLYSPTTKQIRTIATILVSTKYTDKEGNVTEAEDGLLGVNIDPNFAQNHWVYLYYSDPDAARNILTRYELKGDELVLSSKKVILEVPTQREQCCHTGGSIDWDRAGNLYLSTGDNTSPRATLYAPLMNAKAAARGMPRNRRVIRTTCAAKSCGFTLKPMAVTPFPMVTYSRREH